MIKKAYIRCRESLPESSSTYAAQEGFRQLGVETEPFSDLETLLLGPEVAVCGYVSDVLAGLEKLGISKPLPLDYPDELTEYCGRMIHQSQFGEIANIKWPLFIKPVKHKLFTGRVYSGNIHDRIALAGIQDDERIWVSPVVDFNAEFRCFVLENKLLGVRLYRGDWSVGPEKATVYGAVMAYSSAPVAYALDFGVTSDGRTLLVEANDAFALGNYGLDPVLYARMISARWEELTRAARSQSAAL
jgi:hypothetical protein